MEPVRELNVENSSPEEINAASDKILAPEAPQAPPPPDPRISLPAGYIPPGTGVAVTEAEVRELNGEDEEHFAKERWGDSTALMISGVLKRGVVSIGDMASPPAPVFGELLLCDRMALYIGIRRVTYGNDVPISVTCPSCNQTYEVAVELDTLDSEPLTTPRLIEIPLRHGGQAEVMLLTGAVHEEMDTAVTVAEQNTIALARCIKKLNGSPFVGLDAARRLGSLDRKNILDALFANQPGPRLDNIDVQCQKCGEERKLTLTVRDIFRV